jgi:hypothetical protein
MTSDMSDKPAGGGPQTADIRKGLSQELYCDKNTTHVADACPRGSQTGGAMKKILIFALLIVASICPFASAQNAAQENIN